jgi:hypothetical protein
MSNQHPAWIVAQFTLLAHSLDTDTKHLCYKGEFQ